jgi:hypothetical protein
MEKKHHDIQGEANKKTLTDEINVRGRVIKVPIIEIDNKRIIVTGTFLKTANLKEEWFEDVEDPESLIIHLKKVRTNADIFAFWQRLPETTPKFNYYLDRYSLAALPISSYDDWWKNKISSKTRNMVRKSEKKGIEIRLADFDDAFVNGMTEIFNETPVRQGYSFPHYGKSFETVKREFAEHLHRATILGTYYGNELIGFCILVHAGTFAITSQFLCKIAYRDMAPANGLMAKVVEVCVNKGMPYLVYGYWHEGTLGDFVRHHGFVKIDLPQYYVPLTLKGKIFLRAGIHKELSAVIPKGLKSFLVELRRMWFSMPWHSRKNASKE